MIDWKTFRPIGKWMTVKSDPRTKQSKGGIYLPDGQVQAERKMEGTGYVLKVGSRVENGIEPGMRICYRGFLKDASAMEFERHEDGCQVFMIRVEDVLAVIDDKVQMGLLS